MKYLLLLFVFLAQTGCAINHRVQLGDDSVVVQEYKGTGKTYVHVHHNEQTALKAAKAVIRRDGGSLITLVHSGGRNIVFI